MKTQKLITILFGGNWGQRIVVIGSILLYGWLSFTRPDAAVQSFSSGINTFIQMFTLILAALLIASALETLLSQDALAGWLGEAAGVRGVVFAGIIGGLLPGGPYATYPIIRGVADRGASYPAMLTMLIGYSLVGIVRVPFGLAFFPTWIVVARVAIAVPLTILVGLGLHYVSKTRIGSRVLTFSDN